MPPGVSGRRTAPDAMDGDHHWYPTMEEFKDFKTYMEYLESQGAHEKGVALVHVPDEWIPRKSGYNLADFNYEIAGPIKQHFKQIGGRGSYQTKGIVQPKMTVLEYEKLANSSQYRPPNAETYDDLERKYWKTLSFCPPIYGCDVSDSITDPDQESWNIRDLGTILNMVNEDYDKIVQGVNSPYLYFGMWKATFSWHVEDMDLHSINYLHYGAPKTWYVVPPKYGHLMEKAARELFPNVASWCSNFMRHKTCLISPQQLDKYGIPYTKVVQPERCAIIVFPYAYHSGFNHGFNIAESTNFALERWIEYGKRARQCDCSRSRVTFSMDTFVKRFQPEKFEDWKNGKDIAPHPEDPDDVREQVMLRANNPDEYKKRMQERLWLGDKSRKKAKPRATCTEEVKEEGGDTKTITAPVQAAPVTGKSKTYRVYQHHEYKMLKVTLNPETWHCYRGIQKFREMMDMEDDQEVNFGELVEKGDLIHIDDEVVHLGAGTGAKRAREPREIQQEVCIYAHKEQKELEATVHPVTLTLMGEPSQELLDYLGGGDDDRVKIKEEIKSGVFEFKMNGSIKVPNPKWSPEDDKPPPMKRMKTEKFLSLVPVSAMEKMAIRASIYRHTSLQELVTLTAKGNMMGRCPSKPFLECLNNRSVKDLVDSGTIEKVGERNVNTSAKLGEVAHGHFSLSGNDEIHVEVAVGCKSIVYKIESRHNESVTPVLKSKNLSDLVNNGVLIRKIKSEADQVNGDVDNVDSINIPSEVMLLALAFPCSLSKCEKHVDEKRVASSDDKENCCPVKGQSLLAWNLKDHGKEVVVKVDEVTQTVCLVFGPKTLVVRKLDIFPHDLLDGWRDVPDTAAAVGDSGDGGDGGLVNGGEVSEPVAPEPNEDDEWGDDYDDDDDSDEENQAFTSDEEQESDAESSDDPDFMGAGRWDSYEWKHSSTQKRKKKKVKKEKLAKMREKRLRMGGDGRRRQDRGFLRGKRKEHYEGFLATTKAILERFEVQADGGDVSPEEKLMISPSDLAEKLQRPFVEVSKAMELFKLFEVAELIEPNEILYQWVDTERLEHWLKRIYNSSEDDEDGGEGVGGDSLPKVVKGVVKTLLHERRGRRYYMPMLAYEQFGSVSYMTSVNGVMATLEALNLVAHQRDDYAKGFEYVGPDIDKDVRQELFNAYSNKEGYPLLKVSTVSVRRTEVDLEVTPWPKIQRFPVSKRSAYHYNARDNWSEERIEEEKQRSVANAERVCKCGTVYATDKFASKSKVHTGFKKRSRCKNCEGCLAPKCGMCQPCLRPPLKKPCIERVCKFPVIPKCPCFA